MSRHRLRPLIVCALFVASSSRTARALEVTVGEVQRVGSTVRATLELRDAFPPRFAELLQKDGTLHLRIQTEMWEDRTAWDKLLRPSLAAAFRITRDRKTGAVLVLDPVGGVSTHPRAPQPLSIRVDVAPAERIAEASRYYLRVVATLGVVAEREIEDLNEAVFGSDEDADGVGSVGKYVLRKFLQASSYLQSVSAEASSRKFPGKQLLSPR